MLVDQALVPWVVLLHFWAPLPCASLAAAVWVLWCRQDGVCGSCSVGRMGLCCGVCGPVVWAGWGLWSDVGRMGPCFLAFSSDLSVQFGMAAPSPEPAPELPSSLAAGLAHGGIQNLSFKTSAHDFVRSFS